ncbi:hypothetical protein IPF37_00895 [bacterium]|nr:MAG: hypothetical protein IPF37_00895 [bacterium]
MLKKIIKVSIFCMGLASVPALAESQDFVIKKEEPASPLIGMSKNALKEHLGQLTRRVFGQTISLDCTLGAVQQRLARLCVTVREEIKNNNDAHHSLTLSAKLHGAIGTLLIEKSTVQNKLSAVVENLIENQGPFKSASRKDLRASATIVEDLNKNLADRVVALEKINEDMQKDLDAVAYKALIERLGKAINNNVCLLKEVRTQFSSDGCLKKL